MIDRRTAWLALASSLLLALLAVRVAVTGSLFFAFLPWNLFLAWVPYGLAAAFVRVEGLPRRPTVVVASLGVLWLLFFPNAPYILTDVVHLERSAAGMRLVDGTLWAAYALVALALGLHSLGRVHGVVRRRWGRRVGGAFVAGACGLAGVGVWVGRVLRWNSWDVLTNPAGLVKTTLASLLDPLAHLPAIGFSLAFGLALLLTYGVASWLRGRGPAAEDGGGGPGIPVEAARERMW